MTQANSDVQNIAVTEMLPDDLAFVLRIQNELSLSPWSREDYLRELNLTDSISLTITENNVRKGFLVARLIISIFTAEIYNIGIEEISRRKGFGKLLLENMLQICSERDIQTVWLEVRASNAAAINFYKSSGFEVTAERRNFYVSPVENAFVMKLDLADRKQPANNQRKKTNT